MKALSRSGMIGVRCLARYSTVMFCYDIFVFSGIRHSEAENVDALLKE